LRKYPAGNIPKDNRLC